MDAILLRPIRDRCRGAWHQAGERVEICGTIRRADFDSRKLTRIRFADGSTGLVFEGELGQPLDVTCLSKLEHR